MHAGTRIVLLVCLAGLLSACAGILTPEAPKAVSGGIRFSVAVQAAKSVALVGSFNGWSPTAHRLTPVGLDGLWSTVVPLKQGEHSFMYLIDGKTWMVPPQAQDFVTDGFGNTNGIVVVR